MILGSKANCLRIEGRNTGEKGVTGCGVIDDSQIHLGTFGEKDCLLVNLTAADDEDVLNLLLHRLTLCENEGFVDGTAHINGLWKLQLSILKGTNEGYSLNCGSLETIMFTRLLNGRKRSGND